MGRKTFRKIAPDDKHDRDAAERWFLSRGMPAVLTPRARWSHVVPRSAPALASYATVMVALLIVYFLIGTSEIYIDGAPSPVERIVLTVIVLAVPVAAVVGRRVSSLQSRRAQTIVAIAAMAVAATSAVIQGGSSHLLSAAAVVLVILALTASGAGAVLAWAMQLTMNQIAAMGALFVRALPVLLLTVVFYFNTYVWLMASVISRSRLWLAVLILLTVTVAFIVSGTVARIRPTLTGVSLTDDDAGRLTGTPFATMADRPTTRSLTRSERFNVVLLLAAAQITHLMMVAICTAAIYFALGLVLLSPAVLARWTANGSPDGTILGMTIPVPQALIHMTLLLIALTFMYVSARSVTDDEFKSRFLDPLIADLRATLVARNRYRPQGG
ncbi:hypothetical protein BTO20_15090 [Mycobacterium dioxanotrophicus]|jgi:hypothetical protein|uniref:Integral membrane protein n=2 Tax=Mycobacterium dioxanotrophicus TaxID=482462 RepID=A0A1Y0C3H3_9MYCO|nr:hypothetical protein BTO20_15090 [Mycobacterium dioxanotrophicus]